jgi:hypothetical protein
MSHFSISGAVKRTLSDKIQVGLAKITPHL